MGRIQVRAAWGLGLGLGLGLACDCAAPRCGQVKTSCLTVRWRGRLGCSILKPAQSLVARGAISSLALGSASSAVLALCENGRLCEWRVRRLATAPPAREPVPLLARSAACPASSAGLHPAAPLRRPRAPCHGVSLAVPSERCDAMRCDRPRRTASSARATIWLARCIKCSARGFRRH